MFCRDLKRTAGCKKVAGKLSVDDERWRYLNGLYY